MYVYGTIRKLKSKWKIEKENTVQSFGDCSNAVLLEFRACKKQSYWELISRHEKCFSHISRAPIITVQLCISLPPLNDV